MFVKSFFTMLRLCLLAVFFIVEIKNGLADDENPIISIANGPIMGRRDYTVGQNKTYYVFQGIPYAEPPVDDLRFSAPVKVSNWTDTLNATSEGSQCVQDTNPVLGSEDCLFINVFTPNITAVNLTVMVYIYGGAFIGGNSSQGPDYFLDEDLVFVNFNYRVGIFVLKMKFASGNWGLKDQVLALEWVRDNIAYFGGNPNNVTIFGESAGAASVSYLLQTNKTKGLFNAAIMQSGTSLNLWALNRRAKETAFYVGNALGIYTDNSSTLIEGLRAVGYETLNSVSDTVSTLVTLQNALMGIYYGPVIEPVYDGALFVNNSEELLSQGGFHKVPTIIGFNSNEAAAVGSISGILRLYFLTYDISIENFAPYDLSSSYSQRFLAGSSIKLHYFGLLGAATSTDETVEFISDDQFNRPIRQAVLDQSKYSTVYCYQFSYEGELGGVTNRNFTGVGHAEDLGYLFTTDYTNVSDSDILTRSRLVKLWTNFAKYSNPTPTEDPLLQNVTWIPSGSTAASLNYLDIDTDLEVLQNPFEENMSFYDGIYETFAVDEHPIITIADGPIMGRRDTTVGQKKPYYAFQGIPYAEPPVGDLRFRAPVMKHLVGLETLDATSDGSECVQGSDPVRGSEDCLFINVYTPDYEAAGLPVMVFIHGGAFVVGDASYRQAGPDYFLDEDVVFVSLQYRLGIFGFISTGDEVCSGNWGLKDQVLALEWVRDNIVYFGGNPANVTIFGGSAGGASVSYLLQTNKTKGLFNAAIMQSGTSLNLWALNRRASRTAFYIGEALGIFTLHSSTLLERLRAVDYATLSRISKTVSTLVTLRNALMGTLRLYLATYDVHIENFTPYDLTSNINRLEAGLKIKQHYFGSDGAATCVNESVKFISDDQFNRPIRRAVLDQSKYTNVYFYQFSYQGELGGVQNRNFSGVGHGEDGGYLFRTYFSDVSEADALTRSRMIKLWTNFAKYSNPTPMEDPLFQNVVWTPAGPDPSSLNYLNISTNLKVLQNPFKESMDFYDAIYEQYGQPPYDTY
ncbi:hypothetical protein NQ317_012511 [Molorchus minor]|uniref:Carboxylesterase type B domain-containing protein n=1 Tax=Molorchus minor TaxID=1323400 RepID=A0ABQ9K2Y4_9CUCU|nr:hypothetical protein NQ317_012511 [Molorchus minor]